MVSRYVCRASNDVQWVSRNVWRVYIICTVYFQKCMVCSQHTAVCSVFPVWWVYNICTDYRVSRNEWISKICMVHFQDMYSYFQKCMVGLQDPYVQHVSRNVWWFYKISRNVWWVYKISDLGKLLFPKMKVSSVIVNSLKTGHIHRHN